MQIKKIFLTVLLTLTLVVSGWAQTSSAQKMYQTVQLCMQNIQMAAQKSSQMYAWAQQSGNGQEMQLCQMEVEMHQRMYNALNNLLQNPQALSDPRLQKQVYDGMMEYQYRCSARDFRPYAQIQGPLAQYTAQIQWQTNTPEGQAAHRANLAQGQSNYAQQQANAAQMTAGHNARMQNIQIQGAANTAAHNSRQNYSDSNHANFIHGINNEYHYVNPNTNQGYWVPMDYNNPAVQNPDGSYTPLQQQYYQNY